MSKIIDILCDLPMNVPPEANGDCCLDGQCNLKQLEQSILAAMKEDGWYHFPEPVVPEGYVKIDDVLAMLPKKVTNVRGENNVRLEEWKNGYNIAIDECIAAVKGVTEVKEGETI